MQAERKTRFSAAHEVVNDSAVPAAGRDELLEMNNPKLSESKRAKTEHNFDPQAQDGYLT